MRYISFSIEGAARWGWTDGDRVWPLDHVHPSLKAAIEAGPLGGVPATDGSSFALADVVFLPVLPDPGKILCVGLNYENHRRETGRAEVAHPTIFTRFADSQTGHGAPILRPKESEKLDYEGELAIVIGKGDGGSPRPTLWTISPAIAATMTDRSATGRRIRFSLPPARISRRRALSAPGW
ncbi:fumarylacetoacetate hydrolase family protein [Rhizorhabdus histidinilytica]